jgi:hypothetical protein
MAKTLGRRWPTRSNSQKSNGLDALFKSTVKKFSENSIDAFPMCVFDYRTGQMGAMNYKILIYKMKS